jgi:hypothetical protein
MKAGTSTRPISPCPRQTLQGSSPGAWRGRRS